MKSPRVIIAGAGLMGRWHAYYARRAGARVAGVVDPLRRLDGERHFDDLASALEVLQPDIAHLCTPTDTHLPLVVECLDAGVHVLCEKPLTMTAVETEQLLDKAVSRNLMLGVVHQLPHQRGLRRLHRRLSELGTIEEASFVAATSGAAGRPPDERRRILHEILPHPFSVLTALFGREVLTTDWLPLVNDDDRLELAATVGAVRLNVVISATARPTCNELTIRGSRAQGFADFFHGYSVIHRSPDTRLAKALRPFRSAGATCAAAASNLVSRGLRRQPAYPGLPELITDFYDCTGATGDANSRVSNRETLIGISRQIDAVSRR